MSKIPPQLRESLPALLQTATAFTFRHPGPPSPLKDFLAATQHFVERFLEVGRAFRELLSDLRNILFKALLDLLPKELLESSVAEAFGVLRRMIGDNVRDEGAGQALGALVGVLG